VDKAEKRKLLDKVRTQSGADVGEEAFDLCERAAQRIVADLKLRKKSVSETARLVYHSDRVSAAARTIASETGSTRASVPMGIAFLLIAAIVSYLYVVHKTDHYGVQTMWEHLKSFGIESIK